MADFQAIGSVSATLQTLLLDRMDFPTALLSSGQSVAVTVDAPPLYEPNEGAAPAEVPQVNLFLYRVVENAFLKNQEIPGHGSTAYGTPPLSLELFYLLTAYGRSSQGADIGDSKLAQYLLGSAMSVFHDFPIITESLTRHSAAVIGDPILDPRLFDEFEQLRLCLYPLSLEDAAKVWTALAQPYRLSAAYVVSATQIESRRPRRFPRPVGEPPTAGPRISAVTLARPEVSDLHVIRDGTEHAYPYARIGDTLVVLGKGFVGGVVRLAIGPLQFIVKPTTASRIEAPIPDASLPDGTPISAEDRLQPGAHGVRVLIGVDAIPQVSFDSNAAVFMLVPKITGAINLDPPTADPQLMHIDGVRLWQEGLPAQTVIAGFVTPAAAYSTASPTHIDVPLVDSLPRTKVVSLVGGDASAFTGTQGSTQLEVQFGTTNRVLSLAPMADLDAAARLLGAAIRAVDTASAFANARVAVVRNGGEARLVIVPGGLRAAVSVTAHQGDWIAGTLGLTAGAGATSVEGYLSGGLDPFPKVRAATPVLSVTIDGVQRQVSLGARPSTLGEAASKLETAIRGSTPLDPNFAATRAAVLGSQLLILPGNGKPIQIDAVAGVDETSVRDLQLKATYLVRVRVNGAESLDGAAVTLP